MGLLDYYRQFEGLSEEEVNEGLREEAAERRRKALTRVDTLDLSQTTWPELPHPRIVSAITYVARRGLFRYPHVRGTELRDELATSLGVEPGTADSRQRRRGAAQLGHARAHRARSAAADDLALLSALPDHGATRARPCRTDHGGIDELIEAAREPSTRVIALASPNDPTGELLASSELDRLLAGVPESVAVLLDESLVEFADAQPIGSSVQLLQKHPRLFIFRSFSKAWGLAGLRVGYAIGGPGSEELLAELAPDLGVSEVSQAGAREALRSCSGLLARQVRVICEERPRLTEGLRERGFEVADSQANFVWAAHPSVSGGELAARLAQAGILVAEGDALGEPQHVRIGIRNSAATARLFAAIDKAL